MHRIYKKKTEENRTSGNSRAGTTQDGSDEGDEVSTDILPKCRGMSVRV
jgi:hypothetical protein